MKTSKKVRFTALPLALLMAALTVLMAAPANAAGVAPGLGSADTYAVLGGMAVANTDNSFVSGDLGVAPGGRITGFPPGTVTEGAIHTGDASAAQAQSDAGAAYDNLGGQACDLDLSGRDLGEFTVTPGVYCFSSAAPLTGTLTLDTQGNPDAVFIFQIAGSLTTADSSSVVVLGGIQACNVFWKVGDAVSLGRNSSLTGNVLALNSINANNGAMVDGRLLARTDRVALDNNMITKRTCVPPPVPLAPAGPLGSLLGSILGPVTSAIAPVTNAALPFQLPIINPIVTPAAAPTILSTNIALTSSSPSSKAGEPVTYTARVTDAAGLPVTTGRVIFFDGANALSSEPVNGEGVATLTTSTLTPGEHPMSAVYEGGPGVPGSTSLKLSQVVAPGIVPVAAAAATQAPTTPRVGSPAPATAANGQTVPRTGPLVPIGPTAALGLSLIMVGLMLNYAGGLGNQLRLGHEYWAPEYWASRVQEFSPGATLAVVNSAVLDFANRAKALAMSQLRG